MSAVEQDLAMDGFCLVGIAGGGKRLRASKAFLEKRERLTSRSSVSERYEAPSGTGTITCTCTGCLGRKYTRYEAGTSANSRLMGGAVPAAGH